MGLQDFVVTPLYILLFTFVAYIIRPYVSNGYTRRYFIPALLVRFFGAISIGLIYQFYYDGGDTFNYWEHGSKLIRQAFYNDFATGLELLSYSSLADTNIYPYSTEIWFSSVPSSYTVIRVGALFDLLSFGTYSTTALFFSLLSFTGLWSLYSQVVRLYPNHANKLAFGLLFFPSVILWGSGILKDTLSLTAICLIVSRILKVYIDRSQFNSLDILVVILSTVLLSYVKSYILFAVIPTFAIFFYHANIRKIKYRLIKLLLSPFLILFFAALAWLTLTQSSLANKQYNLQNVAERAKITAYDIRYGWGATAGGQGGYDIGLPDGTFLSLVKLAPAAINVSLFRPYLWEVRNPLMLLAALEAILITYLAFRFLLNGGLKKMMKDPFMIFCFLFVCLFAWAVGASTFNFGTLIRYKIPMIPFLMILLLTNNPTRSRSDI